MALTYEELTEGPLAAEIAQYIAAKNYAAISEVLNRKDITAHGGITASTIRQFLMLNDFLLLIEQSTNETCKMVTRSLDLFPNFDLSEPVIYDKFVVILDALVADVSVIGFTELHKATLINAADKKISRAEQLGITVDSDVVAQALIG